ncbi:MAG: hypothetical protein U0271_15710 [Polyangiaceae bacterium]
MVSSPTRGAVGGSIVLAFGLLVFGLLATCLGGCTPFAIYSQDLERVRGHYKVLEFAQALALLRVLGEDIDALSPSERVLYAYLRGMTDVRLSETVPLDGTTPAALRACARDWLDIASALSRTTENALLPDELARMRATRARLIDVEVDPGACIPPDLAAQLLPRTAETPGVVGVRR